MIFEEALAEHLDAIRDRDIAALVTTVDPHEVVLVKNIGTSHAMGTPSTSAAS